MNSADIQPRLKQRRARWQVLAAVLLATGFIFPFKFAAHDGHGKGAAFGLLLGVGILLGPFAVVRVTKSSPRSRRLTARLAWRLALVAALGNLGQGFAFALLHPGVATVLLQTNFLFVALLGAVWLRERLSVSALIGLFVVALGVGLTRFWDLQAVIRGTDAAVAAPLAGVLWALLAAASFSMMDLISRRDGAGTDSLTANVGRSVLAAALLALVPGTWSDFLTMGPARWAACLAAALLGPALARNLLMTAAKELPAAESALLQQLRPVLALPLASVVFANWPSGMEWIGSLVVVCGVSLARAGSISGDAGRDKRYLAHMSTPLPAECFEALATLIAADGIVRGGELTGLHRAGRAYGVSEDAMEQLEARAKAGEQLSEVELPDLTRWQRALTYAFAVWLAKVDGTISSGELAQLRKLGEMLELDDGRREAARSAVYDIAALPGGHKPEMYDFAALEERLKEKLPASFREHVSTRP